MEVLCYEALHVFTSNAYASAKAYIGNLFLADPVSKCPWGETQVGSGFVYRMSAVGSSGSCFVHPFGCCAVRRNPGEEFMRMSFVYGGSKNLSNKTREANESSRAGSPKRFFESV